MVMAARCLQVSLQQKGLIYSPRDTVLLVPDEWRKKERKRKKMQGDNVYQRQRRTPSFYIAITAAY